MLLQCHPLPRRRKRTRKILPIRRVFLREITPGRRRVATAGHAGTKGDMMIRMSTRRATAVARLARAGSIPAGGTFFFSRVHYNALSIQVGAL